ncbi:hypothetical protein [Persephonella sp.]
MFRWVEVRPYEFISVEDIVWVKLVKQAKQEKSVSHRYLWIFGLKGGFTVKSREFASPKEAEQWISSISEFENLNLLRRG